MKKAESTRRYGELKARWLQIEETGEETDTQEWVEKEMEKAAKKISRRQFEEFLEVDECMTYEEFKNLAA